MIFLGIQDLNNEHGCAWYVRHQNYKSNQGMLMFGNGLNGFLGFWMSGFQSGNQVFFPQILGSHGVTMKLSFNSRIAEKAIQRHPDTERHHNLSVSHSTAIYCFILAIISGAWLWGLWNFSRWMLVLYRSKKRQPAEHLAPCHLFRWTPRGPLKTTQNPPTNRIKWGFGTRAQEVCLEAYSFWLSMVMM